MTPLPIFPADWPLLPARRAWFEGQGYAPAPYEPLQAQVAQAVLLVTPARVGSDFVRPDGVWARYFQEKSLAAVLLQAGIRDRAIAPNYLHWGNLPDNFGLFLQDAQRADEGWTPPDYGERKLEVIWQRFWDGHNKEGFANWLSGAMRALQIADDRLQKDPAYEAQGRMYLAEPDKLRAFENMHLRWTSYRPYLMLAPFFDQMETCGIWLDDIASGWAECKDPSHFAARIHDCRLRIEAVDKLLTSLSPYFKTDSI